MPPRPTDLQLAVDRRRAPVRTCVGCRVAGPATDLVRLTRGADGVLRLGGPSSGRGAWVGAAPECLEAATKRLGRALRAREPLALAALTAEWDGMIRALGRQNVAPDWCPQAGRAVVDPG